MDDATITAPHEAVLICRFDVGEPAAKVAWYKDAKEIYAGSKYDMSWSNGQAKLTIDRTAVADAARYRCEAVNKIGRASTEAQLIVNAAPKIEVDSKFLSKIQVKGGHSIILTANFTGYPVPKASWLHDAAAVSQSADVLIDSGANYSTLTISDSRKRNSGTYSLVAENRVGSDRAEFAVEVWDRPDAPRNLHVVEQYKDYISVAWQAPEGADVTGYVIERREESRQTWSRAGTTTSLRYRATKLFEGTRYVFRVAAENSIGLGAWCEMEESVTAKLPFSPPGAPEKLQIEEMSRNAVTLVWQKPDFDGGSPITGYFVEKRQGYSTR
jgi:titin